MTFTQFVFFFFSLVSVDLITIRIMRKLLLDFLRSKKNKTKMRELYLSQPLQNRITLNYISTLLKHNQKAFLLYHRLYLVFLFSTVPLYVLLILMYLLLEHLVIFMILALIVAKIIIYVIVRSNFDGSMVSIYRKT